MQVQILPVRLLAAGTLTGRPAEPAGMRETTMLNGRVVDVDRIKLRCTNCDDYRDYREGDGEAVYCGECGKKHRRNCLVDTSVPGIDA